MDEPLVRVKFSESAFTHAAPAAPTAPTAPSGPALVPILLPDPAVTSTTQEFNFPGPPVVDGPNNSLLAQPGGEAIVFWEELGGGLQRFYVRKEYLAWWLKGQNLPPLVTTSSPLLPEGNLGVLGPGTAVLYGNSTQSAQQFNGLRLTAGYWLDPCGLWAVEASGFFLGGQSNHFSVNSMTTPVIARPIQIQNLGNLESRELTATPGLSPDALFLLRGGVNVDSSTQFWGAEANLRRVLCAGCNYRIDALAGFRYLDLRESLQITESVTTLKDFPEPSLNPPVQVKAGDNFLSIDRFATRNQFYGGQVGLNGEYRWGRWLFGATAKVGLGVTQETLNIQGSTTLTQAATGNKIVAPGGLYAQPSNIGQFSQSHFAVAPEVGLRVGYQVTDNINIFVGYSVLYLSNVIRPGDQIDRSIDVTQAPFGLGNTVNLPPVTGVQHPTPLFRQTDFWAQGVNVGFEIRY